MAKLAKLATAVKAGDNELAFSDGIKYLSNVEVVMKLRFSCQQLVTAINVGDSLWQLPKLVTACNLPNQTCQSKTNLANHAYWARPTRPNPPIQTKLLGKAVGAWIRSSFRNVFYYWTSTKSWSVPPASPQQTALAIPLSEHMQALPTALIR